MRCVDPGTAIFCSSRMGPSFGFSDIGIIYFSYLYVFLLPSMLKEIIHQFPSNIFSIDIYPCFYVMMMIIAVWGSLGSRTNLGLSYELPHGFGETSFLTGDQSFRVEDIEVFSILPLNEKKLQSFQPYRSLRKIQWYYISLEWMLFIYTVL